MADSAVERAREQVAGGYVCRSSSKGGPSAREILDRRYASGEITREQYQQMKLDLRGSTEPKGCC
jgi:putative membrane protein